MAFGDAYKAYKREQRVAVTIQQVFSRSGRPTINIDLAEFLGTEADWENKLTVQLMRQELIDAMRVILGWAPELVTRFHSDDRNKSAVIRNNPDGSLFLGIAVGKETKRCIVLEHAARYDIAQIVGRQLGAQSGGLSMTDVLNLLRATTQR